MAVTATSRLGPVAPLSGVGRGRRWAVPGGLAMAVAVVGFVIGAKTLFDNSLLTHIATGRIILDTGRVPTVDPYSETALGRPWTVQSWLPSLIYATLEESVGPWAIRLLNGVLTGLVSVGLWRLTGPARELPTRLLLMVGPLALGTRLWGPRPQLFALVFLVGVLLIWRERRSGWLLVPLLWLWVNSHASFPIVVVLLAVAAFGAFLDSRRLPGFELHLLGLAGLGLAVAVVNPLGINLLLFPVRMMGRQEAFEGVVEWAPTDLTDWTGGVLLGLGLLTVVAARRRAPWAHLLPSLAFAAAGLMAFRNLAVAGPVIVACVAPDLAGWLRGPGSWPKLDRRLRPASVVVGVVAVGAVLAQPAFGLDAYPVEEVSHLSDRGLLGRPEVVVLHRGAVGNYLDFRLGPGAGVFMDDRFDFFPLDVVEDHRNLIEGRHLDEIVDRRRPDVILWETDTDLVRRLDERTEWELVSSDGDWTIACRKSSPMIARCR